MHLRRCSPAWQCLGGVAPFSSSKPSVGRDIKTCLSPLCLSSYRRASSSYLIASDVDLVSPLAKLHCVSRASQILHAGRLHKVLNRPIVGTRQRSAESLVGVEIRKLQGKPTKPYETKRIHMQADFLRFPMRYDKLLLESRWQQSLHHVRLVLAKQASFPTRPAIHCEAGKFPHEAG